MRCRARCRPRSTGARANRIDRVTAVEVLTETFRPPIDLDPVADLEAHLAIGWEYEVEVVIDAGFDQVARRVARTLGRLEAIDADTTRLVGSTSNPWWYAEQLARIPTSYRIVTGPEVKEAARQLGDRLIAAADSSTGRG